jgi:hypothetical protein
MSVMTIKAIDSRVPWTRACIRLRSRLQVNWVRDDEHFVGRRTLVLATARKTGHEKMRIPEYGGMLSDSEAAHH